MLSAYEIESTIQDYNKFIEIAASSGMKRESRAEETARLEVRRTELIKAIASLIFGRIEDSTSVQLASKVDARILSAKRELFVLRKEVSAVAEALRSTAFVQFTPERIEQIYADLNIYFGDQIKRDLSDVQEFFAQVTENRSTALSAMKKRLVDRVSTLDEELSNLNEKRAQYLQLIVSPGSIDIYRQLSTQSALRNSNRRIEPQCRDRRQAGCSRPGSGARCLQ